MSPIFMTPACVWRPVGIATLAAATNEEVDAIMDVYEPYLIQLGFLQRTPRGRVATRRAYEHLRRAYAPSANARVAAQMSFLGADGEFGVVSEESRLNESLCLLQPAEIGQGFGIHERSLRKGG